MGVVLVTAVVATTVHDGHHGSRTRHALSVLCVERLAVHTVQGIGQQALRMIQRDPGAVAETSAFKKELGTAG